ncbi:hypothetical protein JST97_12325 [bacterium]|nr:hypothetical protein [bacterium]
MGLDGVELVMAIESIFELSICDADAYKMHTPGLVRDYVCRQMQGRRPRCRSLRMFQVARQVLVENGWKRSEVTLDSPLPWNRFLSKELERRTGQRLSKPASCSWWGWLGWRPEPLTLRQLIRASAPRDWHWTQERIWEAVALVVSEQLGIPLETVSPDADFQAELGMS